MRWLFAFMLGAAAGIALAAGTPVEIDPNTRNPDKQDSEKDKPISARKPRDEREPEAARGESKQ